MNFFKKHPDIAAIITVSFFVIGFSIGVFAGLASLK